MSVRSYGAFDIDTRLLFNIFEKISDVRDNFMNPAALSKMAKQALSHREYNTALTLVFS